METGKMKTGISIEDTLKIAIEAHRGQTDLDGKPVILHPLAVGLMGRNGIEIKAGFLHDVAEDSDITLDAMEEMGVDSEVISVLRLLTHDKSSLDYYGYVDRIIHSGNTAAINVKLNDLRHNIQRGRESYRKALEEKDEAMMKKLERINAKHLKALKLFERQGLA
ncbi:MAG: GTP pyrophosphokinase [Clostridium sp.]|nr:hypothetical protein [Bacteroides sp.]MCM1199205.1 GTP pyrophosphokinase [Clostridium sp.]